MKPTSLIFLVLSVILFLGGFTVCKYAESRAKKTSEPIFDSEKNENGDFVAKKAFGNEAISSVSLKFDGVDVEIVSGGDESYIELVNFEPFSYSFSLASSSISADGTVGFVSSMLDRSEGGLQFRGLRYFFADKPEKTAKKTVKLCVSPYAKLNSLVLTVTNGNVTVTDIANPVDYTISVSGGNLFVSGTETTSVFNATVRDGNFECNTSAALTLIAKIENGECKVAANGAFLPGTTAYELTATGGTVIYDGSILEEDTYRVTPTVTKNLIRISVKNGNLNVNDG